MTKAQEQKARRLARKILAAREVERAAIEQANADLLELIAFCPVGQPLDTGDEVVEIVDQFADRNVVFRPAAVRRFDLREVK
jgi:hypothetical protein